MATLYTIDRNIDQPLSFKGLKAQYICWVAGVVIAALIFFAVLYISGLPSIYCVIVTIGAAALGIMKIYKLSSKYGAHGFEKAASKRKVPKHLISRSRKIFIKQSSWK